MGATFTLHGFIRNIGFGRIRFAGVREARERVIMLVIAVAIVVL